MCVWIFFCVVYFLFFKQKTAYEMRISDWSSDVCSSDLIRSLRRPPLGSFDRRSADGYRAVAGRAMDHLPERTELPRRTAPSRTCAGGNIGGERHGGHRL